MIRKNQQYKRLRRVRGLFHLTFRIKCSDTKLFFLSNGAETWYTYNE